MRLSGNNKSSFSFNPIIIELWMVLLIFVFPNYLFSQNLLKQPESAVFDSLHNRYLVSNWANGSIVEIDSNKIQKYFVTGHGSINGIHIVGNTVFAGCSTSVKGFNLDTKETVMDLTVPGAINLNDITSDNNGNLYVTDFDVKSIIKINIKSQKYSTFVKGLSRNPNGILFDTARNRLLLCSFGYNIPILEINLVDSSVSVVTYTSLAQCDGFTKDNYGNYYISSWETKAIHKFDASFHDPPKIFYRSLEAPVDIAYNTVSNVIIAPIMWLNKIAFIPVEPVSVKMKNKIAKEFILNNNYPNPFNPATTISYSLNVNCYVKINIYNELGQSVIKLIEDYQNVGEYRIEWDGRNSTGELMPSGVYLCRVSFNSSIKIIKLSLIR